MPDGNELINKPRQLWQSAVKAVKGDNTSQLIEDFTSEMTLVAEGVCEDQAKLHDEVKKLTDKQDHDRQRLESQLQALEASIREDQRALDERLTSFDRRIKALESQAKAVTEKSKKSILSGDLLTKIMIIIGMICGSWVLVTILSLFRP